MIIDCRSVKYVRWKEEIKDASEHVIRLAFQEVQSDGKKLIAGNDSTTRGMQEDENQMPMVQKGKGERGNA